MMKFLLIAMLVACKPGTKVKNIPIEKIVVKMGLSYKIDLEKETYTVYFMNGKSYDCKFTLNDQDKMDILKLSQECGLTKLKGNIQVEDNCQMFPKIMTKLSYYAGDNNVQVSIDEGCNKHPLSKEQESEGLLKFLKFLREKISSKPEVAKAPQTDISYI